MLAAAAALPFHELTLTIGRVGLRPFETLLGLALVAAVPGARRGWLCRRFLDREVAAVVALGALALFLMNGPGESARTFRLVIAEPALFYFLLTRLEVDRRRLAAALVLGGVAASLLGFWQWWVGSTIEAEGVERIHGAYRSPNNLALYLDRVVPLAAAMAVYGWGLRRGEGRAVGPHPAFGQAFGSRSGPLPPGEGYYWLLGAMVMVLAQVLTFSIGGWTATGLGLAVVLVLARQRQVLRGLATLAIVGVLVLAVWRPERITSHLTGAGGSTSLLRVRLWGSALEMLWDHPLFGVGLDNFVYAYNPARGGSYLDPAAWREPDLSHPHNVVLDWWLSLGIGGLLLLVGLLERFWRLARAALGGSGGAVALGAVGAMAAALAHGLTDNSFFLPDLAALWWATFVLVGAQQAQDGGLGGP